MELEVGQEGTNTCAPGRLGTNQDSTSAGRHRPKYFGTTYGEDAKICRWCMDSIVKRLALLARILGVVVRHSVWCSGRIDIE
mmetsp:Transcript_5139/g.10590  ORF Transcript_5139/g.10590 Transcript_5139/m.10590 type:complete len:82 (-) Transcript_5139:110-355(-)